MPSPSGHLEREVKLGTLPDFALPDLTGVSEGLTVVAAVPRTLDAIYYDTGDLRLIRSGITVRNRVDTDSGASEWTVKFPTGGVSRSEGRSGPASELLVRDEINEAAPPGEPPSRTTSLVRAHLRTATLEPRARLRTHRRSFELCGPDGTRLAEVDEDDVEVMSGDGATVARFGEVEVELSDEASRGLLRDVVARLRAAGAGAPDPSPKVMKALGPGALEPPDLPPVEVGPKTTAADVVRAGLIAAARRVIDHDRVIRLDEDPEGVHQARVGLRRLRSDLRTFRALVDQSWSEPLREEMRWLAAALGEVRDRDVMLARLRDRADTLPEADVAGAKALVAKLARARDAAQRALIEILDSDRYVALLDRLVDGAARPRLLPDAGRPARDVVPQLAARPWRKLRRAVKGLGEHPSNDELHQLRIRAKRARYAADVAVPVVGGAAQRYTKALADLQDVLGDLHDTAVAEAWLREVSTTASRSQALAAGHLIALERADAARCRDEWPKAWKAARRSKNTRWLKG